MPSTIAPTTVRLTEDTQRGLSLLAKLTNRSKSHIINEALQSYLETKSAYLRDLNEAVASIDTKPTHEASDVFAWMRTWGTENEQPLKSTKLSPKTNN